MSEYFLHGVEVITLDNGVRSISTPKSAVIGLVGTAPDADSTAFPEHTPVLIAGSRREAAKLGATGTLPNALNGILDQCGAFVVVVRVPEGKTEDETIQNLLSTTVNESGTNQGVHALLDANSIVKVVPRLLIAPEFSHHLEVAQALLIVAERLRACAIIDGKNTNDSDVISYRENFGSPRIYIVDPWLKVYDSTIGATRIEPASARVAGLIAKIDATLGFWHSPSNKEILGITGLARPIDFVLGDPNARANFLNENEIATIIQQQGYRLWGNRTTSSDPKWAFLSVQRTADLINDALLTSHLWAVDKNINKTYLEDVTAGVNQYLRQLVNEGAILGGTCWADPELNTPDQLSQGKVFFDFDFTPPAPAEHIIFRSHLVNDYFIEVMSD